MKRRRSKTLGRAELSPAQLLTSALVAANRGDCRLARERYHDAVENADDDDRKHIGGDRFREVHQQVWACKPDGLGYAARRTRRRRSASRARVE